MKINCEYAVWHILPLIRKEFAKSLIKDHGLTQRKAAEILGINESAVSQYLSKKRAKTKTLNADIKKEIKRSTIRIINGNKKVMKTEICRICRLLQSKVFYIEKN